MDIKTALEQAEDAAENMVQESLGITQADFERDKHICSQINTLSLYDVKKLLAKMASMLCTGKDAFSSRIPEAEAPAHQAREQENYEVAFVVEGYLTDGDGDIGNLECNGTREDGGLYFVVDGRAYYGVQARSPKEAYAKAETAFQADDFGALVIEESRLGHVRSITDIYWYAEDLDAMPKESWE